MYVTFTYGTQILGIELDLVLDWYVGDKVDDQNLYLYNCFLMVDSSFKLCSYSCNRIAFSESYGCHNTSSFMFYTGRVGFMRNFRLLWFYPVLSGSVQS